MKKLILCFIIGFIFANFAEARIGETLPELKKRFGKGQALNKSYVKAPNKAIYDFKKNGIKIRAYFIGNKCEMISYSRMSGISEKEAKNYWEQTVDYHIGFPIIPQKCIIQILL